MYNLAKRKFMPKVGDTPDNVGPSTYFFDNYKTFKHNVAPFLSDTARRSIAKKCDYGDAYYNVILPHHIKGGNSIRNRSKREVYQIESGPGPADYDPLIPEKRPAPKPRPPGRGKLYLCTTPKGVLNSIPSIPTKIDENGYFIDDDGGVIKNPPDDHDTTLGPAFYNVNKETYSDIYKGCAWSKRRAKRETFSASDIPGPGTYDIHGTIGQFNERDEYVREMARLFSFVPRYIEAAEMRLLKEGRPGPGEYNVNISAVNLKKSLSIYPQPFISGAKRWKETVSDTPSPTSYNVQNTLKRTPVSYNFVPFGSEAPRFLSKINQTPSAAEYNVLHGNIEEKIAKKREYFGSINVPFNTTARRKMTFVSDDSFYMPGSADYLVEPLKIPQEEAAGCNFKSRTCRFKHVVSEYDVGPASYNISETFNKNRNKVSHSVGKAPFQSTQSKCLGRKTLSKPSPADYSSHHEFTNRGLSFGNALRFDDKFDDFPGPGSYTVAPRYDCAIYKGIGTHNLRLKENVLRKKLRLPPGKTWEAWYKEIRKKRKLKCYKKEKGEVDYIKLLFADE